MSVDFRALLNKPADEIKAPQPLPVGTYYGLLTKYEFLESKNEKKTPYLHYSIQLTGAGEDVDPTDAAEIDFSKKTVYKDFYLTEDSLFRLKDFIEALGHSTTGHTLDTLIPETINASVILSVTHRPNQRDPQRPYVDVNEIKAHN